MEEQLVMNESNFHHVAQKFTSHSLEKVNNELNSMFQAVKVELNF